MQNKLVKKKVLIKDLQALNQVLNVKERDANNGQKKARKTLINVSYFLT